jgi:hypothetical protein
VPKRKSHGHLAHILSAPALGFPELEFSRNWVLPRTVPPRPDATPDHDPARELPVELRDLLDRFDVLVDFELWGRADATPRAWRARVPRREILDVWKRLRALVAQSGCWPVISGVEEDERAHAATAREAQTTFAATVRRGQALSSDEWLANEAALDPDLLREIDGEWPAGAPAATRMQVLGGSSPTSVLLWIETPRGWEVPAALGFGGWNSCPPPAVHVALLRRWHDRFGATLVGLSRDRLELMVARRPAGRAQALALAREHFLYCEELVLHQPGSLPVLAARLMASDIWSFGWD